MKIKWLHICVWLLFQPCSFYLAYEDLCWRQSPKTPAKKEFQVLSSGKIQLPKKISELKDICLLILQLKTHKTMKSDLLNTRFLSVVDFVDTWLDLWSPDRFMSPWNLRNIPRSKLISKARYRAGSHNIWIRLHTGPKKITDIHFFLGP